MDIKVSKGNTWTEGMIEKTLTLLDEIASKTNIKKIVNERGKRIKTLN